MRIDNKWDGLRLEIIQYCKDNNIYENDFTFLNIHQWENVYNRFLKSFVDARYAKNNGLHWSNTEGGFRKDINRIYTFAEGDDNHYSYEWIEKISDIVKCEKVYIFCLKRNKDRSIG